MASSGLIISGGAFARSAYPAYALAPGYVSYAGYAAPAPVACPGRLQGTPAAGVDQWGNVISHSPSRSFSPVFHLQNNFWTKSPEKGPSGVRRAAARPRSIVHSLLGSQLRPRTYRLSH